jgi:hypothetical protein
VAFLKTMVGRVDSIASITGLSGCGARISAGATVNVAVGENALNTPSAKLDPLRVATV